MKISTNVHRDAFGGITISNLSLFNWLEADHDSIVGIEYVIQRHVTAPLIYRKYDPSFFAHHILSAVDIIPRYSWLKLWGGEGRLRKKWGVLLQYTKDILKKEAVDVVLLNGTYHSPWILAQAARELGIPMVLRYAGVMQKEIAECPYFVRRRMLAYEQWIARAADVVIFPSRLCRDVVEREVLGEPLPHATVIPNPVEPSTWRARRRTGRIKIATVGRWTRIKNFEAFINLHTNLLAARWPHRAMMVTPYRSKSFVAPETIEWRESMSHEALLVFFRSIDLLVVPSHFETFSNVAAEAVLAGTPVLVSANVGFSEILRKAGLGRMVIPDFTDIAKAAAAVRRLSRKPITKKEHQAVATLLGSNHVHQRMVRVLRSVVRGTE